jgi:fibronectin-binding autotransporter adhesin
LDRSKYVQERTGNKEVNMNSAQNIKNKLYTIQQVADILGVSTKTLRRWEEKGVVKAQRTIGNQRRYTQNQVDSLQKRLGKSSSAQEENLSQGEMSNFPTSPVIDQNTLLKAIYDSVKSNTQGIKEVNSADASFDNGSIMNHAGQTGGAQKRGSSALQKIAISLSVLTLGLLSITAATIGIFPHLIGGLGARQTDDVLPQNPNLDLPGVLAETIKLEGAEGEITFNISSIFNKKVNINDDLFVDGDATVSGTLTAPNIIYSVIGGQNISVTGDPQNPVISTGPIVSSLGGQSGDLVLTGGSGVTVTGLEVGLTNTSITVTAGSGLSGGGPVDLGGTISLENAGVTGITAGAGISISSSTGNVTITSTTPAGITTVKEDGTIVSSSASIIDFLGGDFDLGESPPGEVNVQLASILTSVSGVAGNFDVSGGLTAGTGDAFSVSTAGGITIPNGQTLTVGTIGLNSAGTSSTTSGAFLIGVFDEFVNSSAANLQAVLNDLDTAIGAGASKFTQNTGFIHLTQTADSVTIGGTSEIAKLGIVGDADEIQFLVRGNSGQTASPLIAVFEDSSGTDLFTINNNGNVIATGTITGSNLSGTNTGDVTLAGENYLSIVGQVITANAVNLSGTHVTGILAAARFGALTGDVTSAGGTYATTIAPDAVELGTDTTGDYVSNLLAGSGISSTGATTGETISHTLSLGALTANWNQTGAFDIVLNHANSELRILESTGNTFFGSLDVGDLSADRTYTLPDYITGTGTICLDDGNCAGAGSGVTTTGGTTNRLARFTGSQEIGLSSINDLYPTGVAVTIDADGNLGVGDSSPAALFTVGNGDLFQVDSGGAIAAATGMTSSGSIRFSAFTSNGGILYTNATGVLAQVAAGTSTQVLKGGATPSFGAVNLGTDVTGTLPIGNGGTGLQTTPTNGQILIGNGTNYTLSTITGTANQIDVTNGAGSITLSLPQNINTTSTATFAAINLTNVTNQITLGTTNTTTITSVAPAVPRIATLPALSADDTFVFENQTQTLTNKTLAAGSNTITGLTNTNLSGTAGITNANLADVPTSTFKGRITAGTGAPEDLTVAQAKTLLDLSGTNSGDVTLSGENYLSIVGQVITANAVNLSGTHVTGILPINRGGTNSNATPTSGGIAYGTGTAYAFTLTGTSGECLLSNGASAPSWGSCTGAGGGSKWSDSGTLTYLSNTTDSVTIGSNLELAKLAVDGDTDEIQLLVQGNATQTSFLAVFEQSDGTDVFTIANNGNITASGDLSANNFSGTSSGNNTGDVTLSGENYLSIVGQVITANAVDLSGTNVTGTLAAARLGTFTGDVTSPGASYALTIANNAVTDAKFRQSAGLSVVGRASNTTGNVADITAANDNEVLYRSGTSLVFGTLPNASLQNSSITFAGNTGSGAISLGGTLNITGAGINNAVYNAGTVTITGVEADTLATVTGRGATTSTASSFTGGATIRSLTVDTATATDDLLNLSVTTGGAARFTGTITNADLTAARTYTLPDESGIICLDSGNCTGGTAGPWDQTSGVVHLDTATDNVTIGSSSNLAKLGVVGDTDEIQFLVRGNAIQTTNPLIAVFENSAGTDLFTINNNGNITASGDLSANNFSGTSSGNNTGDVTLSGENYLSIVGQVITANAVDLSGTNVTGTLAAARLGTFTGDVTSPGASYALTIANNAVTDAKFRQSAGLSVVGRASNTTGNVADITAANDNEVLYRSGTSLVFGTLPNASLQNSSITFAGNTGSGAISLGGTLNITGAGINNAVYNAGTVTITGVEADTLATVTGRGATTSTASSFTGGATIRSLTVDTATATDDLLNLSVTTGGAARFTGTITNADLTAARTYTLPDNSGIIPLGTAGNTLFFTTTGATSLTLPTTGTLATLAGTETLTNKTFTDNVTWFQDQADNTKKLQLDLANIATATTLTLGVPSGAGSSDTICLLAVGNCVGGGGGGAIGGSGTLNRIAKFTPDGNNIGDSGISDTSDALAITINSSEFVGIGDATPTYLLTVGNNDLFGVNSSGNIVWEGATTGDGFQLTLTPGDVGQSTTITLPDPGVATDTICLLTLANCTGSGSGSTLQAAYDADADGSDAIIALTSTDDSLIFRNPATSGTDSPFLLQLDNLATGSTVSNFKNLNLSSSGSFDTTSAALTNYGGYFANTSTRSAGANNLTNVGLYATASGAQNNYAAIFEAGNVGIGTTSPSTTLDVTTTAAGGLRLFRNAANIVSMHFQNTAGSMYAGIDNDGDFAIRNSLDINTANHFLVKSTGNVGIGTTAPNDKLETAGNIRLFNSSSDNAILFQDANINHGLSALITETNGINVHTRIKNADGTIGGTEILGVTDQDLGTGLRLYGVLGVTDPTDTIAGVTINAAKKNTTNVQSLGNLETVLQVQNNASALMTVLGSGNVGIGTTNPSALLSVGSTSQFQVSSAGAITGITLDTGHGANELYAMDQNVRTTDGVTFATVNGLTLTGNADGFSIAGGTTSRTLTVTGANKTLQGAGTTIDLGGNLTLASSFTTVGANALTLTTTGGTNVTLPTTGTLSTLAGTETLTNKTFTDNVTWFQDQTDNTKKLQFDLSNVTTATTLTLGVPTGAGSSDTICLLTSANCVGAGGAIQGSGTANQVAYFDDTNSITSSANFTFNGADVNMDANTLFVQGSTDRVGIGTTGPGAKLQINTGTDATIGQIIRANSATQTADLLRIQDSTGTNLTRVTASGMLFTQGINSGGTTTPAAGQLRLGSSAPSIYFDRNNTTEWLIYQPNANLYVRDATNARMQIEYVAGADASLAQTRISSLLGVGHTSSPTAQVDIRSSTASTIGTVIRGAASQTADLLQLQNSSATPLVVVNSAGNVGIGTTGPLSKLHIESLGAPTLTLSDTDTNKTAGSEGTSIGTLDFRTADPSYTSGFAGRIELEDEGAGNSAAMKFFTTASASFTEKMRITSSGNVGIGTTNPSALFSVGSTSQFQVNSSGAIAAAAGIVSSGNIDFDSLSAGGIVKAAATTGRLSIATAGTDYQAPLTFTNGLTESGETVKLGGTLSEATTLATGNANSLTLTSGLTGGARSTYPMIISQANDATNNNSVGLLQISNADTGSTAALVNISQVTSGTGLSFTGITTGTAITANTVTTGTAFSATGLSTGIGLNATATTTGRAVVFNTTGNALTTGSALSVTGTATGITADYTGALINVTPTRTMTAAATRNDSGNMLNIAPTYNITGTSAANYTVSGATLNINRSATINNTNSTYTLSGAALNIQSNITCTAGTCTDSANILSLAQNNATSTGTVLNLTGAGTGILANLDSTNSGAHGVLIDVQSNSSSQYALNVTSNNGATQGLYVRADGNVGIGTTNPSALLSVGSTSQFQVNSSGAIAAAAGISSSGTIAFSGLSTNGLVKTTGGTGTLAVATAGTDYQAPLTFTNGLTESGGTVKLGGTLSETTTIANGGFNFNITGSGNVGIGTTAPSNRLHALVDDATTNDITNILRLTHSTSGTTAAGIGSGILFEAERTGGTMWAGARVAGIMENVGSSTERMGLSFSTTTGGSSTLQERLRIDGTGNVGIGTTGPAGGLHIRNRGANSLIIQDSGDIPLIQFRNNADTDYSSLGFLSGGLALSGNAVASTDPHIFIVNGGNVGIGTTAPGSKLDISGATGQTLRLTSTNTVLADEEIIGRLAFYASDISTNGTGEKAWIQGISENASGNFSGIAFGTIDNSGATGVERMRINQDGSVGIGTTSPGARLEVGNGIDSLQINSAGDLTFVDADGAASITGPAGGALSITASNSQALNLTTTTAGNISLNPGGAGDIVLTTDNAAGSYINITGLTSGTGNALCVDGSSNVVTCTVGSGGASFTSPSVTNAITKWNNTTGQLTESNLSDNGTTVTIAANINLALASGTGTFTQTYSGTGNAMSVTSTSTTSLNKALNISQTGATSGTDYAGYFSNTGAATTNVGLYATATGATNNYAAIFEAGNVGIGTTTPDDRLHISNSAVSGASTLQFSAGNSTTTGHYSAGRISSGHTNTAYSGAYLDLQYPTAEDTFTTGLRLQNGNVGIGVTNPGAALQIAKTLTANSGTTNNLASITFTTPADSSGTNIHQGLNITPTIGNATAGTNTANIINLAPLTGDAQVTLNAVNIGALTGTAATEYALNIGSGWDSVLRVNGTEVISGTGTVVAGQISGALFSTSSDSGTGAIDRGDTLTLTGGTGIDTSLSGDTYTLVLDSTEVSGTTWGSGSGFTWTFDAGATDPTLAFASNTLTVGGTTLVDVGSSTLRTTGTAQANDFDRSTAGALTLGNTTATSVSICNSAACDTLSLANNADADTITIGDTLDTFTLASTGLNVSSAGALTGVASINTISFSATAIGFAGTGSITSGAGTALSLTSGTTGAVTIDSGSTGGVNIGTGANAKTITIGNTTGATAVNINSGTGGITLRGQQILAMNAGIGTYDNYIDNPGYETGNEDHGWVNNANYTLESTDTRTGNYAVTSTSTGANFYYEHSVDIPTQANEVWYGEVWIKAIGAAGQGSLRFNWIQKDGTNSAITPNTYPGFASTTADTWTKISGMATAPSDAAFVRIYLRTGSGTTGVVHKWDDVYVTKKMTLPQLEIAGTGTALTLSGAATTAIDISNTGVTTDISLQNGATIHNNTVGRISFGGADILVGDNDILDSNAATRITLGATTTLTNTTTTLSGTTTLTASTLGTFTTANSLSLNPTSGTSYTLNTSATTLTAFGTPTTLTLGGAATTFSIGPGGATATTIDLAGGSGATGCTVTGATGAFACTGAVTGSNLSNTNTGDVTLAAIGSTPNANGATLTGQVLNLQPADASFGGVVTTGTQTLAGAKTFSGATTISATGTALTLSGAATTAIDISNTGVTTDIGLQNGETIDNDTDNQINLGLGTSGTLRLTSTTAATIANSAGTLNINPAGGTLATTATTLTASSLATFTTAASLSMGSTSTLTLASNATINGGAAANDNLTLQGTSHATRTTSYVLLQPTAGNVGIGTTAPSSKLTVTSGDITIDRNGTANTGSLYLKSGTSYATDSRTASISVPAGLAGRILNRNPDMLDGTTGYGVYNNAGGTKVAISSVADSAAPSVSGSVLRVSYDGTGTPGTDPTPGFGGFFINASRCTGTNNGVNGFCYRDGNRYVHRIWAKIPSGRTLIFASNATGTGGTHQTINSWTGTGNWESYEAIQTIGTGGTFSSTGFWYISGGSNVAFTWDVAQVNVVGVDEAPSVLATSNLNVGYYQGANLNYGQFLTTQDAYLAVSGGNVGIGMTNPGAKLDISSTSNTQATLAMTNNTATTIGAGANTLGVLDMQSTSLTTGNFINIETNALTTGKAINVTSTGTGLTSGSLLNLSSATTGAVATNGIVSLNATGNYTSTSNAGLLNVLANATTAGTVANLSGTALTTGTILNLNAGTALTTGTALNISGASYAPAASATGNLVNLSFTGAAANTTGNSIVNGIRIASTINTSGATGTKAINAINIASPTKTACTGGACTWVGLNIADPGTLANTTFYSALFQGGNVGIGTTAPTQELQIGTSASVAGTADIQTGRLFVGTGGDSQSFSSQSTTNAGDGLTVMNGASIRLHAPSSYLVNEMTSIYSDAARSLTIQAAASSSTKSIKFVQNSTGLLTTSFEGRMITKPISDIVQAFEVQNAAGNSLLRVDSTTGNVGIGTTTPGSLLQVGANSAAAPGTPTGVARIFGSAATATIGTEDIIGLSRPFNSGVSFGKYAAISLGGYSGASDRRARLDFKLSETADTPDVTVMTLQGNGNVGIGITNPSYLLDVNNGANATYPLNLVSSSKFVRIGALNATYAHVDTDTTSGFYFYDAVRTGADNNKLGLSSENSYVVANGGNFGIGDVTPAALFTVGNGDLFQVNSSGNLTFNQTSPTISIGNTGSLVFNDGTNTLCSITDAGTTGNLSCTGNITGAATGTVGYWSRSGTTLSPATAGDAITTSGNISTSSTGTITSAGLLTASGGLTIAANQNITMTSGTGTFTQTYSGTGNAMSVTSTSTTSLNKALNISQTGATSGTDYAGYFSNTGAATTNVGLYATATGATNNYAAIFEAGNVGIGTTAPATKLNISDTRDTALRVGSTANDSSWVAGTSTFGQLEFYSADASGGGAGIRSAIRALAVNTSGSGNSLSFSTSSTTTNDIERLRIDNTGNVGIGTTAPSQKLDVYDGSVEIDYGNLRLTHHAVPGAPTVAVNTTAGNLTGNYQYRITYVTSQGETGLGTASAVVSPSGEQVNLSAIPTGTSGVVTQRKIYRTLAGGTTYYFLATISDNVTTTYTDNIADGSLTTLANAQNTAGGRILLNGVQALSFDTSSANTAAGYNVLSANTSGTYNTGLGYFALNATTTGLYNTAIGGLSMRLNTTGNYNVAVGMQTLYSNASGAGNIAQGFTTLYANTTGDYNIGHGYQTLRYNETGSYNVALGFQAGFGATTASNITGNVLAGYRAGYALLTGGNYNTILGYAAGDAITTGARNIIIGYNVDAVSATGNDQLNIGNTIYGDLSTDFVGIGISNPNNKLTIEGTSFTGGSFQNATAGVVGINGDAYTAGDVIALDYYTSGSTIPKARIGTRVESNGSYLQFGTSNNYGTGITNTAMTIDPSGNVGIGQTNPGNLLTVNQSGNATAATASTYGFALNNAASTNFTIGSDATYAYLQSWSKPLSINSQGNHTYINPGNSSVVIGSTNSSSNFKLDLTGGFGVTTGGYNGNSIASLFDVNSAAIRIGDPISSQTFTNGMGIKFVDVGTAHASMRYLPSANRIDFCNSSASATSLACNASAETLSLDLANTRVGIGTTAPGVKLDVRGNGSGIDPTQFQINIYDDRTAAAGVGGGIGFSGKYTSGGAVAGFSSIWGAKENATDSNYASYLGFGTRANGGSVTEQMRISSAGNVGIGITNPATRLHVKGLDVGENDAVAILENSNCGTGCAQEDFSENLRLLNINTNGRVGMGFYVGTGGIDAVENIWMGTDNGGSNFSIAANVAGTLTERFRIQSSTGNVGIGTTGPAGLLDVSRAISAAPSTTGKYLSLSASTLTDNTTAASGTATSNYFNTIAAPTLAATNTSVTTTLASTFSILGAPIKGTNNTATNAIALHIATVNVGAQTASTALRVEAMSGATANYAATFTGGNVGIGVAAPAKTLDVQGEIQLNLAGTQTSVALCGSHTAGSGASVSDVNIVDCTGTPAADYMEMYSVEDGLEMGDIVVPSATRITTKDGERLSKLTKSTGAYQSSVIGIISDKNKAGDFNSIGYNIKDEDNPQPVALSGRVPVKVASSSAEIKAGDYITSSNEAGRAMKATRAGQMIGKALEDWTPGSGKNTIMVFVSTSYADPNNVLASLKFDENGNLILPIDEEAEIEALGGSPETKPEPKKDLAWTLADLMKRITKLEDDSASSPQGSGSATLNATDSARLSLLEDKVEANISDIAGLRSKDQDLATRIASLEADLILFASASATFSQTASSSAELSLDTLDAKDVDITGTLRVGGRATLSDVGVTGIMNIGLLTIDGLSENGFATLNTTSGPLKIQSEGINGVDILDGKVVIEPNGNMKIEGTVTVKKLNIDTEEVASASLGTAIIPSGATTIDVTTTALTPDSKIFVTAERPTAIGAKPVDTDKFTITIQAPPVSDLKVNWWIIN